MKKWICLMLAVFLLLTLVGCALPTQQPAETTAAPTETEPPETFPDETMDEEESEEPIAEGSFTLAYIVKYGLNPYTCMSLTNRPILSLMYESLFVLNNQFEPEPVLCKQFAVSDNGRTYVLTIEEDACFSDGTRLTAKDVVESLYAASGSSYYGSRFAQVTGFGASDERTVVITLAGPYENLPLILDVPIVKSGTTEETVPVGSGPFRLSGMKLLRNRNWWQDGVSPVDAEQIYLNRAGSPSDVRDDFEFGGTTLVCVDFNAPSSVGYRCDYELWDCPTTTMQYIGFNLLSGICADPVFRAALTHVIDRETLIASIYKGFASAAYLPCAPGSPLYDEKLASKYGYDPDAFATALRLSSVKKDFTGTILVCSADTARVELAHAIADTLAGYGLQIKVNAMDYDSYLYALSIGNFDMFIGETRLAGNFDLTEFFKPYGTLGFGGLANYQVQQYCTDSLENSGNYYDLHKSIMDNGYICPLLFKSYAVMVSRGAISKLQSAVDNVFHLPGGRTLADATVPYSELAYGAPEEESETETETAP